MRRAAALVAALAALLPGSVSAPSTPHRELSLVVARTVWLGGPDPFEFDLGCGDEPCPERWSGGRFEQAFALYGRPVATGFHAEMRSGRNYFGTRLKLSPALLVVEWQQDGSYHVLAESFSDGMACLKREELDWLDWHPAGNGIVQRDGGVCADLSGLT